MDTSPAPGDGPPAEVAGGVVGTVALLRRFPLRSAGGERPARVRVETGGLDGDRGWVLAATGDDAVLTAKQLPALAGARARAVGGQLVLDTPIDDLARAAGRPVEVRRSADAAAGERHSGGAAVHVISAGAAGAPDAPAGCDPGERANVVVQLAGDLAPGVERGWVGRALHVGGDGGAVLRISRTPSRCLGVYAEVVRPGWVARGDQVVLGQ